MWLCSEGHKTGQYGEMKGFITDIEKCPVVRQEMLLPFVPQTNVREVHEVTGN